MDEIRVNVGFLENLASRLDESASSLRSYTQLGGSNLHCSPKVQRAYEDLGNRWDEKREDLAKGLDTLAADFRTTAQSFTETDEELSRALTDDSPRCTE